jgi:hypothetical protein
MNDKDMKLTLVSIWHRGNRTSFMVPLQNGKLPHEILTWMLKEAKVPTGSCYSLGG